MAEYQRAQDLGYSDLMPVVPGFGTGLSPLVQWLAIPTLARWIAIGRRPWVDQRLGQE